MRYSQLFLLAVTLLMPVRFTAAAAAGAPRDVPAGTEWRLTSFGETGAPDVETEKELIRIIQSLMDAVAVGDKAVWERHVADDLVWKRIK